MSALISVNNFEEIYQKTYQTVLKYVVCKCQNLDDVNELVQDSYVELYQVLERKRLLKLEDETAYMIGIAKNIVKKYYRNQYQEKSNLLYFSKEKQENQLEYPDDIDLEENFIQQENVAQIWNYLNKKDVVIAKIFYLYYALDLKIAEISKELEMNESTIKNKIYRTLKELKEIFGKEDKNIEK